MFSAVCTSIYADNPFKLEVSEDFQPDFKSPKRYSREEMEKMAWEVLTKLQDRMGVFFNRRDPQHVWALADFFGLTSRSDLDIASTPMEEPDVRYFTEVDTYGAKEYYPQDAVDLAIRFYWESLARMAAAHMKAEAIRRGRFESSLKSRGNLSELATSAMFDKTPGMSLKYAKSLGKERYDISRLVQELRVKGAPTRY